ENPSAEAKAGPRLNGPPFTSTVSICLAPVHTTLRNPDPVVLGPLGCCWLTLMKTPPVAPCGHWKKTGTAICVGATNAAFFPICTLVPAAGALRADGTTR